MSLGLKKIILGAGMALAGCEGVQSPESPANYSDIARLQRWVATCCGSPSFAELENGAVISKDKCKPFEPSPNSCLPFESFRMDGEDGNLLHQIASGQIR